MKNSTGLLNSILIVALSCFCQFANAQIVYTDVNPDITTADTFNLDLNNDGIIDFVITQPEGTTTAQLPCHGSRNNFYIRITPSGSNEVVDSSTGYVTKMAGSDSINASTLAWSSNANQLMSSYTWFISRFNCVWVSWSGGRWYDAVDGYLGLKLIANSNTYYGWARLNTYGATAITIMDYAYNSIPDQPILAGQGCSVVSSLIYASGDLTFCKGSSVTLTADYNATQFQWNKNGTAITEATNGSYTASESGAYTCNLTNSCGTIASDSSVVTVNKKPKAIVTPTGIVSMCAGSVTTLSSNSGDNLSYQWKKNGTNISGETNSTLAVTQAGDYKVKVTNINTGCTKTSKATTVNITCKAGEVLNAEKLLVSPNPFSQSTVISFQLVKDENVSLKIFDVEGRLIRTLASDVMSAGAHELTWNARDKNGNAVSAGIYLLKISTADKSETIRLSVVN